MKKVVKVFIMKKIFIIVLTMVVFTNCFAATDVAKISQGNYYTINSGKIYAVTFGKGPNVIFLSGLGGDLSGWQKVAPSIAEHAQVILYDRPGSGKSDLNIQFQKARTAKDAAEDLLALLAELQVKPPYILVGMSLGGLYAQYFARVYPEKTAGVILVDSSSPFQSMHDPLPGKNENYYFEAAGIRTSEKQVKQAKPFPKVPLIVLSATIHGPQNSNSNSSENNKKWAGLQEDLSKMSDNSQYITANNTGHLIQKEKPWLVIAAINEIIRLTNESYPTH